jgi:4-carboxymuconolactone decarboxylase
MAKAPPSARRERLRPLLPKLLELTDDVAYGDIWERPGLSKRDRSLITIAALVAMVRPDQLVTHLQRGINNGLTRDEIVEVITHMAIYAGWPAAMTAAHIATDVFIDGRTE